MQPTTLLTRWLIALPVLAVVVLAGCASTPEASRERDAEAKQFSTHPGSSTIYVYLPDFGETHDDRDRVLWVNNKLIGGTLPHTYFRINVEPGKQTLNGMGADNGRFTLETRAGELYFVSMSVTASNSVFRQVPVEIGQQAIIACCKLLENWTPGQRPLLR